MQVKSVKTGSVFWAACTSLSYFYMVSFMHWLNIPPFYLVIALQLPFFKSCQCNGTGKYMYMGREYSNLGVWNTGILVASYHVQL